MHEMMLDRRALLTGAAAMSLTGAAAMAAPRDWPNVQAFLDRYVDGRQLACCVVAIRRGRSAPEYMSKGTLALDTDLKAGPDSLFRIYSMTKPITAVAFLSLVDKGVLRADQPVSDILPEFRVQRVMVDGKLETTRPAAKPMLMRHLVTHSAGLSYHINGDAPLAQAYAANGLLAGTRALTGDLMRPTDKFPPVRDLETFGRRLATLPLDFDPGSKWQYSVGLDLMGLVIQRASGMPFSDYLQQTLFGPLRMTDTDFIAPGLKKARLTSVYDGANNRLTVNDDRKDSPYLFDRDLPSGGGGLISTARDYLRFQSMLLNNGTLDGARILKPETALVARSNMMDLGVPVIGIGGEGNQYGAGMRILGRPSPQGEAAGTYGWAGAAGTSMWIDPVNQLAVNGMVQIMNGVVIHAPLREAVYKDLARRR